MIIEGNEIDIDDVVRIVSYAHANEINSGVLFTDASIVLLKMELSELRTCFDADFFTVIDNTNYNFKTMTPCSEIATGSMAVFGKRTFYFSESPSEIERLRLMEGVDEVDNNSLSL